jgi:hypothetical protein
MKKLSAVLVGLVVFSSALSLADTSAFALGNCGRNGHRDHGRCVFGGQNQNYCLKVSGHVAHRDPDGVMRCHI